MPMDEARAPPASSRKCSGGTRVARRSRYRVVPSAVACPPIMGLIMLSARPSGLSIDDQDQPHRDQASGPEPAGPATGARQPQLEPAPPPRERAEDGDRHVSDLG